MKITGFNKLTLLDFPNKVACIIFTQGCNFKCGYCQNSMLIPKSKDAEITEEEVLEYLKKRKSLLDGIVISGGEPTIQKDLVSFIRKVKDLGFLVKLDTNGSNPIVLKELIDNNLVDYVAMDIKHILDKYEVITKCKVNIDNIKKSIDLLINSNIDYEFRTTIIKNVHEIKTILEICGYFDKDISVYLQNFEQSEGVLDKTLDSFSKEELIEINNKIRKKFPNVIIRGI